MLNWSGDLVIIPLFEPEGDNKEQLASLNAQATELDAKLDGALSELISLNELKGKPGSSSLVRLGKSAPVSKYYSSSDSILSRLMDFLFSCES